MSTVQHNMAPETALHSWRRHMRTTLVVGVPLVGSSIGGMLMNVTDTVMLGRYGIAELAAGSIATQFWFTVMMFGAGFAYAVVPMASQAEGRGDVVQVRRSVRMGLWVCWAFCLTVMPVLWFTEDIFLTLRQEPEVARLSGEYMRIAQWAIFFLLGAWTLRGFLTAIERTLFVFWATMIGVVVNIILNWLFIFGNLGMPEMGMRGAAVATMGTNGFVFAAIALYCVRNVRAAPYALFVRFWRADWEAFRDVFRLGLPIGLMITAETGMFIFSSVFMGWFGVVALAAHGIALQLGSLTFMVPMGMSQAATARVGTFYARDDAANLWRASWTVMGLCLAFASAAAVMFFAIPEPLIRLFLDMSKPEAAAVVAYGVPLLFIAACFQLVDTAQAIGAALLRGLSDTRTPMIIACIAYWPVGLGLSYVLGVGLGWEGVGVWIGLATGLAVAALVLNWRFFLVAPREK